jgi:trimeric autotransporter adhesin
MTSKNQVSPVIRISRGERDASARATHLKAASKKYLETTIERKQMSTTTNFKRIALVAIAALGLGVLSSVPSQAVINSDSLTLSSATASQTTAETYTATSAVVTVSFFGAKGDSMTVTSALLEAPDGSTAVPVLRLIETSSAVIDSAIAVVGAGATANGVTTITAGTDNKRDSSTVGMNTAVGISAISSTARTTAKYAVYLANQTRNVLAPAVVGTYRIKLTPAAIGVGPLVNATAQTLTITVTAAAALDRTPSAATSTSIMYGGNPAADLFTAATVDSVVTTVRTLSATPAAVIFATLKNAAGLTNAVDSITATVTGPGQLGSGAAGSITASGRSITVKQGDYVGVFSDGVAGTATITLTSFTAGVAIGTAKTVTFTSTTATSYAAPTIAATDSSVIKAGTSTTVSVFAKDGVNNVSGLDSAGTGGATTIWAYSSDTAVATVAAPGGFNALTGYSAVVTGVAAGTANISFGNAATRAAATIVSPTVAVRVGTDVPSNVTVTLDKSTYAPGEKMTMTVTILNAAALPVVGKTSYADIFSAAGVTSSVNLSGATITLPAKDIADYSNTTNTKTFTLYAPVTGGPVVFSWTGGTGLATANQVARSVTVNVTDSGAAALAAVTALATTVASLRTLIVTLTNLVLKIQKKVRA